MVGWRHRGMAQFESALFDFLENPRQILTVRIGMFLDNVAHQDSMVIGMGACGTHRAAANTILKEVFRQNRAALSAFDQRDSQIPIFISGQRHASVEASHVENRFPPCQRRRAYGIFDEEVWKFTRG